MYYFVGLGRGLTILYNKAFHYAVGCTFGYAVGCALGYGAICWGQKVIVLLLNLRLYG